MSEEYQKADWINAYRPFFFEGVSGITSVGANKVLLCDRNKGILTEVDLLSEIETFQKQYNVNDFAGVDSICYLDNFLYFVYKNQIYKAEYHSQKDKLEPYLVTQIFDCLSFQGIAINENRIIYLITEDNHIFSYNINTQEVESIGTSPGISSVDDLCYWQDNLLIIDAKEQTVYVFNLEKCEIIDAILTPFENPTGITVVYNEKVGKDILYVAYSRPSFEVYDTGNSEFKLKIDTAIRDNFIYPLIYQSDREKKAVLSNGFLIEMSYIRKLHALPEIAQEYRKVINLDWKISIPMDSDRQKLLSLQPIGNLPMKIEEITEEENRKVAVFSIDEIDLATERSIFGWKALIKLQSIKYWVKEEEVRDISKEELQRYSKCLQNEPKLDLESPYVIKAAKRAIKNVSEEQQNNVLAKAKAIRDYIYRKVTYVMDAYNDGTEAVLKSGQGSCGEYLNVFLSLFRLNNIPARRCGNYKVPIYKIQPGAKSLFLSPDFNHVWLQFYVPDLGWVPLESSADDEAASLREWTKRYFMALSWYHVECRMGDYFEDIFEKRNNQPLFLSPNDLSINDIKFKVISELNI
ncbi:MAG: transglutaminase domain-containing protein [Hydrococcus sp. RU_2_2]|nr:transglutaminase domain-containing protein [Hydrococcus sp. RU_2_2]